MILVKTIAPQLVDATAIHSREFLQKNTQLCSFSYNLSAEYALSFGFRDFAQSANPINALRNHMQNIVLLGPQIDAQTLQMHVDKVLSLPPQMVQPLIREIDDAFVAANQRRAPSDDFPGKLANLLNQCGGPCNYFKPIGDVIALLANSMQQNTNNVAPAWDGESSLLHAPLNIAGATFNKISTAAQQLLAGIATATKSVFAQATQPLFSAARKSTETDLLTQNKSMSFTAHGSYFATDPFPYFQTQNNASNLLARSRSSLNDCFRLHEFKYRYNPLDANMNLAVATNPTIYTASEGATYALDVFGKPKMPVKKSSKMSIKEYLDFKESNFDWDDSENWNNYPNTGNRETEPTAADSNNQQAQAPADAKANVAARITDYAQANDPYKDSNTMKGVGAGGIGEGKGPAGLKGGNYLLKDYSMAVSPDVEAQMRASGIKLGDWVNVQTADGRTFAKRFDDRTASNLTGRVDFYSPVGRAPGLDSSVTVITKAAGPPAGYIQPPRYINGVAQ